MPRSPETLALLRRALAEDIGRGDATTESLIPPRTRAEAIILCKGEGTLCGLPVAARVFRLLSPAVRFRPCFRDGDPLQRGLVAAHLSGPARSILTGERVALNLLSHLSGIATATRELADLCGKEGPVVLDTRKTLPGMRRLQRYAVRTGGGRNHRYDLSSMILIKDNHLVMAGSVTEAVRRARAGRWRRLPVEVEVKTMDELREALAAGVDRVMLDNMTPAQVRRASALAAGLVPLEVSGGITPGKVAALRGAGVDFLSSGALTHSVRALDFSLEVTAAP